MPTSRVVLLMLLLNVLTVAGGVGASYWLLKPGLGSAAAEDGAPRGEPTEYQFHAVNKIIVSKRGEGREHYFVVDLALQADASKEAPNFEQAEPIVRNSVVAYLSGMALDELRGLSIGELQSRLEQALLADFASRNAVVPFRHVLINKLIAQ